jgi:hypothetical protein
MALRWRRHYEQSVGFRYRCVNSIEIFHVDRASPQRFDAPAGRLAADDDLRFPSFGLLATTEQLGCIAEAKKEQLARGCHCDDRIESGRRLYRILSRIRGFRPMRRTGAAPSGHHPRHHETVGFMATSNSWRRVALCFVVGILIGICWVLVSR